MSRDRAVTPAAVLLMGPTGSGKTALALELARRWPIEIVSVDSANVYRGMDIGTSKPTPAERAEVPHHLIDIRDPREAYSAGEFRRDAERLIGEIRARGRVPLLVGGTMLYFRALRAGLATLPPQDPALRACIDARARELGWATLHAELAKRDPLAASRIQPADGQRIQRALEVLELTGRPLSALQAEASPGAVATEAFALLPYERPELYQRLNARFVEMLARGLVDEVRSLRARGDLHADLPSVRAVGYRQIWRHLAGECALEEAVAAGQRATRQLAKRQLTWLRAEPGVRWIRSLADQELVTISRVIAEVGGCGPSGSVC
jgi:tRNA dimethylallyltransferase